jgi:threonine dehydratase
MVVEGAGATPVAALTEGRIPLSEDDTTVAVLCGGNIDVNMMSRIIDRGLWADGRAAWLEVIGRDRPGFLNRVTRTVAELGANVMHIAHHRTVGDISVGDVRIMLQIETRGRDHVVQIKTRLREDGHEVVEER